MIEDGEAPDAPEDGLLVSERFENVWDAIEDTPDDAAIMTLRSDLLTRV